MTRDDIIRMARECGFFPAGDGYYTCDNEDMDRFAALISEAAKAAEREECAKVCEEIGNESASDHEAGGAYMCTDAIRARGEK